MLHTVGKLAIWLRWWPSYWSCVREFQRGKRTDSSGSWLQTERQKLSKYYIDFLAFLPYSFQASVTPAHAAPIGPGFLVNQWVLILIWLFLANWGQRSRSNILVSNWMQGTPEGTVMETVGIIKSFKNFFSLVLIQIWCLWSPYRWAKHSTRLLSFPMLSAQSCLLKCAQNFGGKMSCVKCGTDRQKESRHNNRILNHVSKA